MISKGVMVNLLILSVVTTCVWCRAEGSLENVLTRLRRTLNTHQQESLHPFSHKTLEKMLEKAILKIIMGDLSSGDMLLLKSLNYSLDEVLAIRQRELARNRDQQLENPIKTKQVQVKSWTESTQVNQDILDVDAYNKQAVYDYENLANKMEQELEQQQINTDRDTIHSEFDRGMEPHVVFKIRYDDLDMDSTSMETSHKPIQTVLEATKTNLMDSSSTPRATRDSFQFPPDISTALPLPYRLTTEENSQYSNVPQEELTTVESSPPKRVSEYEGLEWIEDDVYRVIPEALNDVASMESQNDTVDDDDDYHTTNSSEEEMTNDDSGYMRDLGREEILETVNNENGTGNLSTYQQLALAHRRDTNQSSFDSQGQKAIEDIKLRVLAMTGRFNLTSSSNQIQRERLTMFSPTCEIPKNTDADIWHDPLAMNMHFQLNLTSGDHVVAAKLRIYKLPQSNLTIPTSTSGFEDDEEEEKKIRISIFFYTKSLKKHRSKKRLMDSLVTSLKPEGSHLALDVRQALRFWRQTPRTHGSTTNNHGLVIQVEDQDGKSLRPAQYIQQDSCHTTENNNDDKAYQRVPALFLQACSRYVRVVKGETVTYVNCKHSSRRNRHQRENSRFV